MLRHVRHERDTLAMDANDVLGWLAQHPSPTVSVVTALGQEAQLAVQDLAERGLITRSDGPAQPWTLTEYGRDALHKRVP